MWPLSRGRAYQLRLVRANLQRIRQGAPLFGCFSHRAGDEVKARWLAAWVARSPLFRIRGERNRD